MKRIYSTVLTLLFFVGICGAQTAANHWGETPKLTVEGNHLVNTYGEQVMLHGIMDTPSPYFCGYRFTDNHWIDVYKDGDKYIDKCINYFDKIFTAATDTQQGSWCNVFRLHLDPCWTDNPNVKAMGFTVKQEKYTDTDGKEKTREVTRDPHGQEVSGEANIIHFSQSRLKTYLTKLYVPIAKKAQARGMYVIMRPPGVCPNTIKMGDYYQTYLINVWDEVTKNAEVLANSDWLSIELANEPINITEANGQKLNTTKRDYFQPIVDKIRANGFKGIIWIPGETWQQDYRSYGIYPVKDTGNEANPQLGYAVHWYPGWYSTSDKSYDAKNSLKSFLNSVPVTKTHPIMITEVDWSPENPNGQGKYNEWGEWVLPNYGTWGTGSTSKFGLAYKSVIDYVGNAGMTLTHTHDYMDIDHYLSTGKLRPAFTTTMADTYEACSGACFQWYKEYANSVIEANTWDKSGEYYFDEANEVKNAAAALNGKTYAVTNEALTHFWNVSESYPSGPQDVRSEEMDNWSDGDYCYMKFKLVSNPGCATTGNLYTIQMADEMGSTYGLWGATGNFNAQPGGSVLFALGLGSKYGQDADYCGLWKLDYEEGHGYTMQNVGRLEGGKSAYVSPESASPVGSKVYVRLFTKVSKKTASLNDVVSEPVAQSTIFDIHGRRMPSLQKGMNIIRRADGSVKKVIVK